MPERVRVDEQLPRRVPLVAMYDEVLHNHWSSSMPARRRDREIFETRGQYTLAVETPRSSKITLPPRARKRPSNNDTVVLYPDFLSSPSLHICFRSTNPL
jgi:hypothetical protein